MKKYFSYELKKNLIPILVLSLIATAIHLTQIIASRQLFAEINAGDRAYYGTSFVNFTAILLCMLCAVVPAMTFSFKMNKRCVDEFYSLPIRREKLYLVKSLAGLCEVFIPFAVSYWCGVVMIAVFGAPFNFGYYFLLFLIAMPLGTLLFGVNAFAFTCANKPFDGLVFMGFFASAILIFVVGVILIFPSPEALSAMVVWTPYSPVYITFAEFDYLIRGEGAFSLGGFGIVGFILMIFLGCACWFGLFYRTRYDKAENAAQVSDSWFGYKTFLPYYLFLSVAIMPMRSWMIMYYVGMAISALIGNIIYRRTFRLPLRDLLILVVAFAAGLLVGGLQAL